LNALPLPLKLLALDEPGSFNAKIAAVRKRAGRYFPIHGAENNCKCELTDPNDPTAPCKRCVARGMKCDGREWPKHKAEQIQKEKEYEHSADVLAYFSEILSSLSKKVEDGFSQLNAKITTMDLKMMNMENRLAVLESGGSHSAG
jgi:hypothetical protein